MIREVTDRVERQQELRARAAQLERQNEQLEEVASIVSHDLRNPLNVIEGRLELARESGDPRHFEAIEENVDRMNALVDGMLATARQGQTVTDREVIALAAVVDDAWSHVDTGTATLVNETTRHVRADRDRVLHLFENLFRNSVEHGSTGTRTESGDAVEPGSTASRPEAEDGVDHGLGDDRGGAGVSDGGANGDGAAVARGTSPADAARLTVRVRDLEDGFFVADDGPGIPEGASDAVFERGYTTARDGTGFGLAIVKTVAEAHGWSVTATESREGGARFDVRTG